MNRKQFLILLVLVLVIGGAGYYLYKGKKESFRTGDAAIGQKLFPDFPINDIAQITLTNGQGEVNLVKVEDTWRVKERYNYSANFSEVGDMIRKVWELKPVQTVKVGQSQLGRLELNQPEPGKTNAATVLSFKDKSGKEVEKLLLGKKVMRESQASPFGGGGGEFPVGRYITTGKGGGVWLINDAMSNVETKPENWLNKDFFKVEKLKSVAVTHPEATNSWKLARETESGELKLMDAKEGEQSDTSKTSGAGYALSSPSFSDVASPDAKPEDLGLEQPIVAELTTFDDFTYTVKIGKPVKDDNHHIQMAVDAKIQAERTPGKDEKPEDKEKLDKEFKDKIQKLQDKLKQEKNYEKWTYLVGKWTVDPLLKVRKDLLSEKKEEEKKPEGAEITPPAEIKKDPLSDVLNAPILPPVPEQK